MGKMAWRAFGAIKWISTGLLIPGLLCPSAEAWPFKPPEQPFQVRAEHWVEAHPSTLGENQIALVSAFPDKQWWLQFNDSHLAYYIEAAHEHNHDLKAALARVLQARASVRDTISKQLPTLNVIPSIFRLDVPKNLSNQGTIPEHIQGFALPFSVRYEADLFGKYWDQTKAARKQEKFALWDSRATEILITAETATAYFNLLSTNDLIQSQTQRLALLNEIDRLKRSQNQSGLLDYTEVLRADRDVAEAQISLNDYIGKRSLYAHQLSVLTGELPQSEADLPRAASIAQLAIPPCITVGIPAALVARRPDILAQEQLLDQADINVRVARKMFLPTVTVNDLFGFTRDDLGHVFSGDSFFNLLFGSATQSLFQGGKIVANLRLQQAKRKEHLEIYQQTILNAFQEVEDQLSALRNNAEDMDSNRKEVKLAQQDAELKANMYQHGLASWVDVLQVRNDLAKYEQDLTKGKTEAALIMANLYKALGGGY